MATSDRNADRHRGKPRGLRLTDDIWQQLIPVAAHFGVSRIRLAYDHLLYLVGHPDGVLRKRPPLS